MRSRKKISPSRFVLGLFALSGVVLLSCMENDWLWADTEYKDWSVTGGSKENIKYSQLNQIDTGNVQDLEVAWVYHSESNDSTKFGPMQSNPVIVDNKLYAVSPRMKLFSVDAATGRELWKFDPADSIQNPKWHLSNVNMNRGISYWTDGKDKRIIFAVGPLVFALDPDSGQLIKSFGQEGAIDLRKGLGRDEKLMSVSLTSPAMVYQDLFIVGGLVSDETPGHIRGYDVRTGEQRWIFHTIPQPDEFGFDTWTDTTAYKRMGSTNSWSGFTLDEKRGIVFCGTGNPTNDFYGGDRIGDGLYGNSILALDAKTGKRLWHFQTVHHDVWDMDISSPPILVTINKDGKKIDAVAQTTKTGMIFILERTTGKPVYRIEERPVPTDNAVLGERVATRQQFPVKPVPFVRQILREEDLNQLVPEDSYLDILTRFRSYNSKGIYTPPSLNGTVILPGYDGGGEWGGPSFDPETGILYVNANEMTWVLNLVKLENKTGGPKNNMEAGAILYKKNCMTCHGPERLGAGDYPGLIGVGKKYNLPQFKELLSNGRRMMPGFAHLSDAEKEALGAFLLELKDKQGQPYKGDPATLKASDHGDKPRYTSTGYNKFLTKEGYPAINPPWGTLNAINLNTGEYVWKVPFGEFEELKKKGIPTTGRENYGGGVVTSGGLIFIAATADGKFRAFNKKTGKILFETELPASGVATPSTYQINGKQYVVIACGGSKWGGKQGDAIVAFALPENKDKK